MKNFASKVTKKLFKNLVSEKTKFNKVYNKFVVYKNFCSAKNEISQENSNKIEEKVEVHVDCKINF